MINIRLLLILLFTFKAFANMPPILSTKQDITNMRFLSSDGKFTYYQRRSGDLLLSTNYEVKETLKGAAGSNYEIVASMARRKLIVVQDEHYHTLYGLRFAKPIYGLDWGDNAPTKIGEGVAPALHLDDSIVSIFNPSKKTISFYNFSGSELNFSIQTYNSANPYLVPYVIMPNEKTVLFTDLNSQGIPGVIAFDKVSKKMRTIAKAGTINSKFELCLGKNEIFIGQFAIGPYGKGSSIISIPRTDSTMNTKTPLYESKAGDLGNMICDIENDRLFFIKNTTDSSLKEKFEVAALSIKDKKIAILTTFDHVTQIINLDGKLLVPFQGKHYILIGENNLGLDQLKGK